MKYRLIGKDKMIQKEENFTNNSVLKDRRDAQGLTSERR